MIYILFAVIICALLYKKMRIHMIEVGFLLIMCGFLLWFLIGTLLSIDMWPREEVVKEYTLSPITYEETDKGLTYLYVTKDLTYIYSIETENGIHEEKMSASNVYINEGEYDPVMKIYKLEAAKGKWYHYLVSHPLFLSIVSSYDRTEFYVPKGSIIRESIRDK